MEKLKSGALLPPEYRDLLDKFEEGEREKIEYILRTALAAFRELTISDIWEQPELAVTYWVLLLSGENQEEELEIAKTLLVWKAFSAKDSAQVVCIPHSDRERFKCCSSTFAAVKTPTLILGDNRDMDQAIIIHPQLLFTLAAQKGGLQRFFTEIHSSIENGASLSDISNQLETDRFWSGLKLLYSEIKSFITKK